MDKTKELLLRIAELRISIAKRAELVHHKKEEWRYIMRYNIRRWNEDSKNSQSTVLKDCERLEVVKQVIKAIDNAENLEATISVLEKVE